jgi:hypothetical protein
LDHEVKMVIKLIELSKVGGGGTTKL